MKKDKYTERKEGKKYKIFWKLLAISIAFVVVGSCTVLYRSITTSTLDSPFENRNIISLVSPSFIPISGASEILQGTSFLDDEAGISAYTNVGQQIDLDDAKNAFRTIEYETDDYIIGSVPLPDYPETEDVHCYVHVDGWVVTYYLNDEPVAKIVDWKDYTTEETITGTKLEDGIYEVCNAAYVVAGDIYYYNFEWPIAEKLMIVADAEWTSGYDEFQILLPSDFIFYERSYSHCARFSYGYYSRMYIDENEISYVPGEETDYNTLLPSELQTDMTHTIKVDPNRGGGAFGAIVLVYRET